jgi:ABC transport system ATP-binding/permease protein
VAQTVLLHAQDLILDFGDGRLLDNSNFQVNARDRIAIIGRNGEGKSSLIKIMQGIIKPDSGSCQLQSGITTAQLEQSIPEDLPGTIHEWVSAPINASEDWSSQHLADIVISELKLQPDAKMNALSGGTLRRALLARALVEEPDILFLDEPTNHLDIDSIEWLEGYLKKYKKAIVFVTHDRLFMQAISTRIFELDRGQLTCWDGTYYNFLKHKENLLESEKTAQELFDKRLAEEERWIRQGIKARRTRNEGRVRALKKMRAERSERRERVGTMSISQNDISGSSKQIVVLKNISFKHDTSEIIKNFSIKIMRGDKIGIIGANGCGKSTLIKIIIGELKPTSGSRETAHELKVAYLDQHRAQLDLNATAQDAVSQGSNEVIVNGKQKHIISYLQDFMFTPQKARSKVRVLSGGERNRLLLAKILLQPCDILVMDEPTNDLDIESLELLEEFLSAFKGTLLLVSHDRSLLNNAATNCLVFNENGEIENLIGGYDEAITQIRSQLNSGAENTAPQTIAPKTTQNNKSRKQLEKITKKIEKTEAEIKSLQNTMAQQDYYTQEQNIIDNDSIKLEILQKQLDKLYSEWEDIEGA